jgi:hypothetical protein
VGTAGKNIGKAHLKGAFSEAAVVCLRNHPQGQRYLGRLEKKPDQGQALTILAHKLARAVSSLLMRTTALDRDMCLRAYESSAGEPAVSLDSQRNEPEASVLTVLFARVFERQGGHLGPVALSLTVCLDLRSGFSLDGDGRTRLACAAPPLSLTLTGESPVLNQPAE